MTLRDALIRDEDLRLSPYRCPAGKLTIGVGHNLDAKPISKRAALVILDDDIEDAERELAAVLPWTAELDAPRREALVNMVFNLGMGGLLKFKRMLAALRRGDYAAAAAETLDSDYAKQVGARARRVARQIETGERQ
jgi:lysozyme